MPTKPLGRKSYGSIGHLPNSRLGPGDHSVHEGQARILTERTRDKHDLVIVQEKLDGSNVGVARINNEIVPLTRAGYRAIDSHYEMHHKFHAWVMERETRFRATLAEGERLCGEWLIQAHGTRYALPHEPFVAFDIMHNDVRLCYAEFGNKAETGDFERAHLLHAGGAAPVEYCLTHADAENQHGALEPIEGVVYRLERNGKVEFLAKYVRPNKVDGKYLNGAPVWNAWVE